MTLWNTSSVDQRVEDFTVGNDYQLDAKLVWYDCKGSIAHARMLASIGILTAPEEKLLVDELFAIMELAQQGNFPISRQQEDCHTAIEEHLTGKLGDAGKKIHTGRSRNDQVLTALRLYYKEELASLKGEILELAAATDGVVERHGDVELPGFTHTRKAMPSSVAMWAGGYGQAMRDNLVLLEATLALLDQSPLGTGAGYGVPLPLDRVQTASTLGFAQVQESPVYVQLSRGKFESTLLHTLSQVLYDLNRLASDLILFSMPEFGFFDLPASLCTGSSMMPHKKNPDILELVRARYHLLNGWEMQVKGIAANLISGYHRDLQLTKEPAMRGLEETRRTVDIMTLVLSRLAIDAQACAAAMTPELYATAQAYELVRNGVPFREAYLQVARKFRDPDGQ